MKNTLIEVVNLRKHFPVNKGLLFSKKIGAIQAVDGINFTINQGETFGLVGESGCGKTTTARLLLLLEKQTDGTIFFNGTDLRNFTKKELKEYRASVQPVFQNPYSCLNPRRRIGKIISEPLVVNQDLTKEQIKDKVERSLDVVGIGPDKADLFPHEFSGGQRQRIAIARALVLNPKLLILDEPVSALDVSIRAQIMNLLRKVQVAFNLTYLLIAHDLAVVKHMSNRIGVMYLGKLVEIAESDELHRNPLHPYTKALHSAVLPFHPDFKQEEILLPGEVSSSFNPPPGCRFHPRCQEAKSICSQKEPPLLQLENGHQVACHLSCG